MTSKGSTLNLAFWLHLLLLAAGWLGPFLFSWELMLTGYSIIFLQFIFLGRCVVNKMHDLDATDNYTFYSFLLESVGINLNRKRLFWFVRKALYPLLAAFTLFWQVYLGYSPLLF
jgi:hypothetical protein